MDDHADTLLFLAKLLQKLGGDVKTAGSVADAVRCLDRERFDLLISDLGLPDGTGYDLMTQARQRQPLKGIALSGFDSSDEVRRGQQAGFCEHLVKPVDMKKLVTAIGRTMGGSPPAAPPA